MASAAVMPVSRWTPSLVRPVRRQTNNEVPFGMYGPACTPTEVVQLEGELAYEVGPAGDGIEPPPEYEPLFETRTDGSTVSVTGTVWGNVCGNRLEGVFAMIGGDLHLFVNVHISDADLLCPESPDETTYRATFFDVREGTRDVFVLHRYLLLNAETFHELGTVDVRQPPTTHQDQGPPGYRGISSDPSIFDQEHPLSAYRI